LENVRRAVQRIACEAATTRLRAARRVAELEEEQRTLLELAEELATSPLQLSSTEPTKPATAPKPQQSFFEAVVK